MEIERKTFSFDVIETKAEVTPDGVNIGIVKGYAATFEQDRVNDIILPGAFERTLREHKERDNRPIRLFWNHNPNFMIGGIDIDKALVDSKGLFVESAINVDTSTGKDTFALARQRVLRDFSVGIIVRDYEINKDGVRIIKDADLFEVSFVPEPANKGAMVTEVKSVIPFGDLPLADTDRVWDSTAAIKRIREFTDSQEEPSDRYRNAFVWYDKADATNFGAYKLPIADVIDGGLRAIPRAIFAAAAAVQGARGGVDIPDADRPGVIRHLERYYQKMKRESPFQKGLGLPELRQMELADIEGILRERLDAKASRFITDAYVAAIKSYTNTAEQKSDALKQSDIAEIYTKLKSLTNKKDKK